MSLETHRHFVLRLNARLSFWKENSPISLEGPGLAENRTIRSGMIRSRVSFLYERSVQWIDKRRVPMLGIDHQNPGAEGSGAFMDRETQRELSSRYGEEALRERLLSQMSRSRNNFRGPGRGRVHYWYMKILVNTAKLVLRTTGLSWWGRKNAMTFEVHETEIPVHDLPPALDNLRILHLSDLHLDSGHGLSERLADEVSQLDFDVAMITGDFRFDDKGPYLPVKEEVQKIMPALDCEHGVFGVLGNHDFIEFVPLLEECGIQILMNEARWIDVNGTKLWLVGVDDPHHYEQDDLERAVRDVPQGDARVLLAHSPELYEEASGLGFYLYLCGHTHGGQFRLPGGFAPILEASCPRKYCAGPWEHHGLLGHTSRGVGSSGVFARFFCPPEIVIHRLVPANREIMTKTPGPSRRIDPARVNPARIDPARVDPAGQHEQPTPA